MEYRVDSEAMTGFVQRYWRILVLILFVPVALAAAYVWFGGMALVQQPAYAAIDSYAFAIAFLVGLVVPLSWYLRTADVSETVALALGLAWALLLGLQDVLVYALLGRLPPDELPWLLDAPVGIAAQALGRATVTGTFLLGFVAVTGVMMVGVMVLLYRWD